MKIDQIFEEWNKDCIINKTDLDNESLNIPYLHAKYYRIYIENRIKLVQLKETYKKLKQVKSEYYTGTLPKSIIEEKKWQRRQTKVLKADLQDYLQADEDIQKLSIKISIQEEKSELLKSIIENINKRGFMIKSAIDFIKFKHGG